jgi:hypothetical protein
LARLADRCGSRRRSRCPQWRRSGRSAGAAGTAAPRPFQRTSFERLRWFVLTLGDEHDTTARVHYASRRRGGVAARRADAAAVVLTPPDCDGRH